MRQQLLDKTALVTGGTDGIGKAIAQLLAERGLKVIIVGRDETKGRLAETKIRVASRNPQVFFHQADLSLMSECRRLAIEIQTQWHALHYLVHSAGVIRSRRELSSEGIEINFATNYLGRFALTELLIPLLSATGTAEDPSRVLVVSGAAQNGKIYFGDVNLTRNFSLIRAILQFCAANDLYTTEMANRLGAAGHQVVVACLKVGVVRTAIRAGFPLWMKVLVPLVMDPLLGQTPEEVAEAARSLLVDVDASDVAGGLFVKIRRLRRANTNSTVSASGQRKRLWELSEQLAFETTATAEKSSSQPHSHSIV